jgi:hypothetical protein
MTSGGATENKVELLARRKCVGRTEVRQPNLEAVIETVVRG